MNFLNAQILVYSSQNELNEKYFVTFIIIGAHKMQKTFCIYFSKVAYFFKYLSVVIACLIPGPGY